MADEQDRDALKPMTDGDITPPAADAGLTPDTSAGTPAGLVSQAKQTLKDNGTKVREQATDRARLYAEDGKAKATDVLGQLSQLLTDAAGQVDEKLGEQYGQYARSAADRVQSFSSSLEAKNVDDLIADARELVRKSPAVAVGAAAAIGFVVARVLTSGLDQRDT
jgi:ElaB/YqjD/DUF883 family membrane-anchored ribosome-binding protein